MSQLFRQQDGRNVGKAPRTERQLLHLPCDGLDDMGVAIPDLMDIVSMEIEKSSSAEVCKTGTAGLFQNIQAGS